MQKFKKMISKFSFAVYGDNDISHKIHSRLLSQILKKNPEFAVHTGDMVRGANQRKEWQSFFTAIRDFEKRNIPFKVALGNHDYTKTFLIFPYSYYDIRKETPPAYKEFSQISFMRTPSGNFMGGWYSFRYKNVYFAILDSTLMDTYRGEGTAQYDWLESDLKKNSDGISDPDFKILICHHPFYSSGRHCIITIGRYTTGEIISSLRKYIESLLLKYKVDLVLSGHDHFYERSYKEGIVYIISAGGGALLYFDRAKNNYRKFFERSHHFIYLKKDENNLTIEPTRIDGTIFDKTVLKKKN